MKSTTYGAETYREIIKMLLVSCLTSQQYASVSQGRICSENCKCCNTEKEVVDQIFYLTQSQFTDTGPTSPDADPKTPCNWQDSHWTGMTRPSTENQTDHVSIGRKFRRSLQDDFVKPGADVASDYHLLLAKLKLKLKRNWTGDSSHRKNTKKNCVTCLFFICRLLTCFTSKHRTKCISRSDLLKQLYELPH